MNAEPEVDATGAPSNDPSTTDVGAELVAKLKQKLEELATTRSCNHELKFDAEMVQFYYSCNKNKVARGVKQKWHVGSNGGKHVCTCCLDPISDEIGELCKTGYAFNTEDSVTEHDFSGNECLVAITYTVTHPAEEDGTPMTKTNLCIRSTFQ